MFYLSFFASLTLASFVQHQALLPLTVSSVPDGTFQKPLPSAQRSACPCLNTLSNHGFLKRDGGENKREDIKRVFKDILNIGEDIGDFFLNGAFNLGMGEGQNETLRLGAVNQQ